MSSIPASPHSAHPHFRPIWAAIVCGVLVALASLGGSIARPSSWYAGLYHPVGTPPDVVFPLVWTALYVLMAIAAWRVWRVQGFATGMVLFIIQLVLNALWMPVTFGAQSLGGAVIVVAFLWLAVAATTAVFQHEDRLAGWLFLPYWLWVSYAGYLTVGLYWLN